jgi:hypothetical protein
MARQSALLDVHPSAKTPTSTPPHRQLDQGFQEELFDQVMVDATLPTDARPVVSAVPHELNLGEHLIQSLDEQWQLRVSMTLTSDQPNFVRFAGALRGKLIQMVYFLVSRRAPEGLRSIEGERRLHSDLKQRFKNVLRGFDFTLSIDQYVVENTGEE